MPTILQLKFSIWLLQCLIRLATDRRERAFCDLLPHSFAWLRNGSKSIHIYRHTWCLLWVTHTVWESMGWRLNCSPLPPYKFLSQFLLFFLFLFLFFPAGLCLRWHGRCFLHVELHFYTLASSCCGVLCQCSGNVSMLALHPFTIVLTLHSVPNPSHSQLLPPHPSLCVAYLAMALSSKQLCAYRCTDHVIFMQRPAEAVAGNPQGFRPRGRSALVLHSRPRVATNVRACYWTKMRFNSL